MSVMMAHANKMQIEQHSIFRVKKLETKTTTKKQENLKKGKVMFPLHSYVRK